MKKYYNCYIHIPFCDLKCKYCRFASIWTIQNLHIEKYVSFLCKEIEENKYNNWKIIIDTIYFWWWTPSVLSEKNLEKIFETLQKKFIFSKNIEITMESTPNNITIKNLENWEKFWINRLSIWLQTLNKKALEEIWRWKKWDINLALKNLSDYFQDNWKIKNISFDFIIWLPYVKKWEILDNIKYVLKNYNFVKHISVYMLEDYYNPDKIVENKFDEITYPENWKNLWLEEKDFFKEYSSIKKYLQKNWFYNYEISNFAKKWFECKHNKWYWEHKETLAFWMWASWFINNTRYLNADNFKDYYSFKKIFEEKLDFDDIFLEKVMFSLRTTGLQKEIYERLNKEKIDFFIKNWYLEKKSNKIILLDKWVLVMDYILREII